MTEINEPDPDTFVPLYLYIDDFVPEPLPEEKPKDDDEVETANEVFGRLQAKETPANGTHKTTAFDNKQLEINLAMCFKGAIDIYLAKNLEGGIPVIEKTAEELFQSLQNLRRKHELA